MEKLILDNDVRSNQYFLYQKLVIELDKYIFQKFLENYKNINLFQS